MAKSKDTKKFIGLILAILVVVIAYFIPESEALTRTGAVSLALLVAAVIMWICDTMPAGVVGLSILMLNVVLGASDLKSAFSGFSSGTVFFVISVFSLTVIMTKSTLVLRFASKLISWAGTSSSKVVLAFMIGAATVSTIMSNVPVVAMFMSLAYTILKSSNAQPGSSNLGKCLMLGIPIAAFTGGIGTPAGSTFNVLAMGMLEQLGGVNIGFLQWVVIGLPIAYVMTIVSWFFIVKTLKPEPIQPKDVKELSEAAANAGSLTGYEKKVLFMLILMPVMWVIGNWVPLFNVTLVSLFGMTIMFLPGMNLLTWDDFQKAVPWNIILMLGSIMSLGNIVAGTGGASYLANMFINSGVMNMSVVAVLIFVAAFVYVLHTFFPVGPAIITLFLAPLIAVCANFDISATVPTIILASVLAGNHLLPINPLNMITYSSGYFETKDMVKSGVGIAVVYVLFLSFWVPFIVRILGV